MVTSKADVQPRTVHLSRDNVSFSCMPTSVSFRTIRRKRSRLDGFGVLADETISKNRRLVDYAGELISNEPGERRKDKYLATGCIWVFSVNRNWSRDAAVGG